MPVQPEPIIEIQSAPEPAPRVPVQEIKRDHAEKVDINDANIKELDDIEGVSYALARNIVRHRRLRGKFSSWEELLKVPGITPALLEQIKKYGEIR